MLLFPNKKKNGIAFGFTMAPVWSLHTFFSYFFFVCFYLIVDFREIRYQQYCTAWARHSNSIYFGHVAFFADFVLGPKNTLGLSNLLHTGRDETFIRFRSAKWKNNSWDMQRLGENNNLKFKKRNGRIANERSYDIRWYDMSHLSWVPFWKREGRQNGLKNHSNPSD